MYMDQLNHNISYFRLGLVSGIKKNIFEEAYKSLVLIRDIFLEWAYDTYGKEINDTSNGSRSFCSISPIFFSHIYFAYQIFT